ncbi:hypothetical protein Bca52824_009368 [Brassica carinata]|uniref:Uncharacterized protein n=1 Tax=Brassica carinata TaxID=52824 RepID=A0A8X7RJU2_BRACI|nr:hypothetical protein Bca52824_049205 [Brassica carinata]KAG2326640.1 hypothetical protein Bca52824_009368 [Brassica carinata]
MIGLGSCLQSVEGSMMITPPGYTSLVGPISFSGPYCQPNIVFQLDGTVIAPTDSKSWGKGTRETKLIVPLNNSVHQNPPRSEFDLKMPSIKPTALRFYGSIGVECHLKSEAANPSGG